MNQMKALSCVLAIVSVNVVCGQRCKNDPEWEDMGPDGCINFMAEAYGGTFSGTGIHCTSIEHAGRYAQLMRFRDSSQAAADASFDALYLKFKAYNSVLDDKVWVNIYRGGNVVGRNANQHEYHTWLKNTIPYTRVCN